MILKKKKNKRENFISVEPDSRVIRECGSNITEVRTECINRHGVSAHQQICECDISYCNGVEPVRTTKHILLIVFPILLFVFEPFLVQVTSHA